MYTTTTQKKKIGVWMDHAQAKIINAEKSKGEIQTIQSSHESRVRFPGEGNDATVLGKFRSSTTESKKNERKMHDTHSYYKQLAAALSAFDDIYICGPTTAPKEFENYLREQKDFSSKKITRNSSDYITDNQIRQQIWKHFDVD